ncbi:MAG: hypothetical protein K0U52_00210 [Gammaproteobacteria bacterium]|jgi:hypothetical protein|nr:hypothetical protein [Gammaproteobacteria bacterium]
MKSTETIKTVCKTCQRTEDDCGQPYTKEYFDIHKGNCMTCAIEAYAQSGEMSAQSEQELKECRKCGKDSELTGAN